MNWISHRLLWVVGLALLCGLAFRATHRTADQQAVWAVDGWRLPRLSHSADDTVHFRLSGSTRVLADSSASTWKAASASGGGRLREGREVREADATFQVASERVRCWLPTLQTSVTVLENLSLERVRERLGRGEQDASWEIEGRITEHQGHNYLLLDRAISNLVTVEDP